ncbi:MAG: hypothetical protein IPP71_15205 [Bacteroidetes bacterium]|nr:hypothetical protein [Bacteroidota bacterium]
MKIQVQFHRTQIILTIGFFSTINFSYSQLVNHTSVISGNQYSQTDENRNIREAIVVGDILMEIQNGFH